MSTLLPWIIASLLGLPAPQEQTPPAQPQGEPTPAQQPVQTQPGPTINLGGQQQPQVPESTITNIKEYRGYDSVPYIRRLEDVKTLDLSKVDFSAPVVARIYGTEITQDEFRLWLAFAGGQTGVRRSLLVHLTQQMVKKALAEGGDAAAFEVPDAEIETHIKSEEEMARAQGEAALKQYKDRIDSTLGFQRYRELIKGHLMSERALLPPITKDEKSAKSLPVESADLLSDQPELRDYLNTAYLNGNDFPAMFRTQFLIMLQEKMIAKADLKFAVEQPLDKGVYMLVGGEPVPTDEILAFVPDSLDVKEVALKLLLTYKAVDHELEKAGALMTPEEFQIVFDAHEAEYKDTLFPLRNIIGLRGFTSMAEYREFYKRRASFERMMQDKVTEDDLRQHHAKFGKLFYETGKISVETLWSSLAVAEQKAPGNILDAWAKCHDQAEAMLAELKGGKPVAELRASMGNPLPADPESGSLASKMRNEIRNLCGETEYIIFINGYSLADDLFYNRLPGEIVGPVKVHHSVLPGLKEAMGYIVAQVVDFRRSGALKAFESQRPLVESDYYDLRFIYFSEECLEKADVELTATR